MRIYLIERDDAVVGYDESAGFVVIAPDEDTAHSLLVGHWGDYKPTGTERITTIGYPHPNHEHAHIVLCDFRAG